MKRYHRSSIIPRNVWDILIPFILVVVVTTIGSSALILKNIHQWEIAHDYPYGRMCESIFTGYVHTCQVK